MDCQSAVADRAAPVIQTPRIECDQAVFTSIPSPMGRGYRIVAASAGVSADERREIIQRAPSHGALSSADADATGLVSFGIAGGRHCVMASWHAEVEHTGRGGFRVHTQIALLDERQFTSVGCDPFGVEPALRAARGRPLVADHRLPMLAFSPISDRAESDCETIDGVAAIAASVLAGDRLLVAREVPDAAAGAIFDMLPFAARRGVTICSGMRFAAARAFSIVFSSMKKAEVEQVLRDHSYVTDESISPDAWKRSPWGDWLRFALRLIATGQRRRLRGWTDRMDSPRSAESLAVLARLAIQLDAVESMLEADLSALLARPNPPAGDPLVAEMHEATIATAQRRLAKLRAAAAIAAEAAVSPTDVTWP